MSRTAFALVAAIVGTSVVVAQPITDPLAGPEAVPQSAFAWMNGTATLDSNSQQ